MALGRLVSLRDLSPEDWERIAGWEDDEEILRYIGKKKLTRIAAAWASGQGHEAGAPAEAPAAAAALSAGRLQDARRRVQAIDATDGAFIGYVELREINWRQRSGELRICIGEKAYWGRGYGTDAMRLFLDFCFDSLKIEYIYLRVYRSNARAIRCYMKSGFAVEGLLRAGRRDWDDDIVLMGHYRGGSLRMVWRRRRR